MNQENKALIAKAKLYIDRANDLDPEVIHELLPKMPCMWIAPD